MNTGTLLSWGGLYISFLVQLFPRDWKIQCGYIGQPLPSHFWVSFDYFAWATLQSRLCFDSWVAFHFLKDLSYSLSSGKKWKDPHIPKVWWSGEKQEADQKGGGGTSEGNMEGKTSIRSTGLLHPLMQMYYRWLDGQEGPTCQACLDIHMLSLWCLWPLD